MEPHVHREAYRAKGERDAPWKFCTCGCVYLQGNWRTFDNAWSVSDGTWRRFVLQVLNLAVVPSQAVERLVIQWARQSHQQQFRGNLDRYWTGKHLFDTNEHTISIETTDQGVVYHTTPSKENHVNFIIQTQRIKAGVVGQILDEGLGGTVLWESDPQEDQIDDDHKVVKSAQVLAIELAEEKFAEVKKGLFA